MKVEGGKLKERKRASGGAEGWDTEGTEEGKRGHGGCGGLRWRQGFAGQVRLRTKPVCAL